jgi:hypothetical protein
MAGFIDGGKKEMTRGFHMLWIVGMNYLEAMF